MRISRFFAATFFIVAMFAVPTFAQQRTGAAQPAATPAAQPTGPVPAAKIAFVNTQAFGDEKAGITRYVAALKNLQREFQPRQTELQTMDTRLKAIADEISKTRSVADPKALQTKQEEGERLQRELEFKKKEYEAAAAKRADEVIGPLNIDIVKALEVFAKARGITMILDVSKEVIFTSVLTLDPAMDVTAAFIVEYNSKNPATASTTTPGR